MISICIRTSLPACSACRGYTSSSGIDITLTIGNCCRSSPACTKSTIAPTGSQPPAPSVHGVRELGDHILEISDGKHSTYVCGYHVMLDTHLSLRIVGNKHLTYKLLAEAGYQGPPYLVYDLASIPRAAEFMEHLNTMVVIKPMQGTGGETGSPPTFTAAVSSGAHPYGLQATIKTCLSNRRYRAIRTGCSISAGNLSTRCGGTLPV